MLVKPNLNKPVFAYSVIAKDDVINNRCPICKSTNLEFKDALSEKEYAISGMCQSCQDSVFG